MPHSRTHPGEEFIDTEWFGYIAIRALVEGRDFRLFLIARRQHNNRRGSPFPHLTNHFVSIKIRKPEVEQDEIGIPSLRFGKSIPPRCDFIESKPMDRQRRPQEPSNFRLVFYHEYCDFLSGHHDSSLRVQVVPGPTMPASLRPVPIRQTAGVP